MSQRHFRKSFHPGQGESLFIQVFELRVWVIDGKNKKMQLVRVEAGNIAGLCLRAGNVSPQLG